MFDIEISGMDSDDEKAEILAKNIMFFCSTPKGSLPQMRSYGLDYSAVSEPFKTFRVKASVDIISGVRRFYGINIKNIEINADENGGIKIKVSV